ncbi:MAG: tetratricopeptide repeat protein [Gemmatimonadota bacterium]
MRTASGIRVAHWIAATGCFIACGGQPVPVVALPQQPALEKSEAEIRELDIAYFSERARRDPTGALDLARLSALYLARGRETGNPRDAILAEESARRSLRNRRERNDAAVQVLVSALLAQHRFTEALPLAKGQRDEDPTNPALRAVVGDIEMELGQYDAARESFAGIHAALGDPAVAPRLARWAEIQGNTERARTLLHAALTTVLRSPEVPREQVAWFWLRVGDVELRAQKYAAADSAYRAGLAAHPDDYRLLSAVARSAELQQNWRRAITFGEKAIGITLDPTTLGVLSTAYAAIGDTGRSEEYARALDVAVLQQPGAYHRAWSLFLLDREEHVARVLSKVRAELKTRKDVYAYDLLAWALHRQGRDREAKEAMTVALAQGTKDAQLDFHAAEIERSLTTGMATR